MLDLWGRLVDGVDMGKLFVAVAAGIAVMVAGVGLYRSQTSQSFDHVCAAYGNIVQGEVVEFDHFSLLVGEPASGRDPCRGDDLWHYMPGALDSVDGVLFDDCVISWKSGGRSTAEAESIPCEVEAQP